MHLLPDYMYEHVLALTCTVMYMTIRSVARDFSGMPTCRGFCFGGKFLY